MNLLMKKRRRKVKRKKNQKNKLQVMDMANEMKMWCLCKKSDGKPIKICVDTGYYDVYAVGFSTKKSLMAAIYGEAEYDEEVKRITFNY